MKKIFIAFVFGLLTISLSAQQTGANISFEKLVHDFGTIKEGDGQATYDFQFTNTGSLPLILNNVKASCGCTSPSWTKEPIPPAGKGFIKVSFNPKGRPGNFTKTISVASNSTQPVTVLKIKGTVLAKEKTPADIYRQKMGDLGMKAKIVSFPKIFNSQNDTKSLDVYNFSDKPISISFDKVPAHIKIAASPATLKPKQEGKIVVVYDAKAKNDWGYVRDYVYVMVNGAKNNSNRLTITANIQEDFSKLTPEQLAKAPKIEFEQEEYQFGTIKQDEKVSFEYKFTNTGKSPLIIRKVKAACGCTAVQQVSTAIAPGESSSIKTTFNSRGRKGQQRKTITVITNDPKKQNIILRLTGTIEN